MDIRTVLKLIWPLLVFWTIATILSQLKAKGYEVYHTHHIAAALSLVVFGLNIWWAKRKANNTTDKLEKK